MLNKLLIGIFIVITFSAGLTFADDTELYLVDSTVRTGKRPQVLFIFDNSGSMSTVEENAVTSYCSEADKNAGVCTYPDGFGTFLENYSGYINDKGTYWNAGGIDNTSNMPTPDKPNDGRRFYKDNNNCNTAAKALVSKGRYTGYLREFSSNRNTWNNLADNNGFNQNDIVDCYEDILNADPVNPGKLKGNSFANGYPINNKSMYTTSATETDRLNSLKNTQFGSGQPVTLYTAHYLVWHKWVTTTKEGQESGGVGTRLDVAKKALISALDSLAVPIDASLAVFNLNFPDESNADGGRVVYDLAEMNSVNKTSLTNLIKGMPAQTNTPLCETLYEAYMYFSGGPVTFGNKDTDYKSLNYKKNTPPSILMTGNYSTPFKKCPDTAYVIYITDGAPTVDKSADLLIKNLTSTAKNKDADYTIFNFKNPQNENDTSYMPALAAYMYNNDVVIGNKDSMGVDNKQNIRIFTIGFSDGADAAADLLEETAFRGGNPRNSDGISKGYYVAKNGLDLVTALDDALKSILTIDSTFTSPSIASNNFDKTQTYNAAYYAMFLPGNGPRWSGNLKKLKVNSAGEIVGPGGSANAIDTNGNISIDTCTYWNACSGVNDGNKVLSGGVLPTLRSQLKNRKIYTNSGTNLVNLATSSFVSSYSQTDLDWLYGVDVDDDDNDDSTSDPREDMMGDPLHSKPLAINFGSATTMDVRIILSTNQGLVHMFKDSDLGSADYSVGSVSESWAFIPNELWGNIPKLRNNPATGVHSVYGMDLSPVAYTKTDSTGKVKDAWLYLGMRSGGTSYYALDISKPDSPTFKWMINSDSTGFEDLGQTWSEPVVTFLKGISDPVLIFGGGMASAQGSGQAVYIVNAKDGTLITKFTDTGMGSVVAKVAILDSDNDGNTDRIYSSDISGNVWRMDLFGTDKDKWTVFKFASIAGPAPDNRMFFAGPVVAQTEFNNVHSDGATLSYQKIPYDAVTIGSGNRDNPLGLSIKDKFYVFQDRNVVTQNFTTKPVTLTSMDLYDVTNSAPSDKDGDIAFGKMKGWQYSFTAIGEKSLSASLIFNGKVYFTSFVPPTNQSVDLDSGVCGFSGQGRLYVFDLHKGTRSYSQVYYEVGERVPDTPQIVIPKPKDGEKAEAYIIGVGKGECENGECKGTIGLGGGLNTNKIYYHINE
ncbi:MULTISPECIES: pilus assembly protein [Shewanella]|jgi:type IV pilus assembly protein PilY1|uniref:PilC/PilY family type IV pilus protein n=1 Tax=Shewanella xiamenensis TaxID=332186 RepID=A0AAE4TPH6_9GAMM|nr:MULTISPECIES: PilC/PilY family type IV pilus protein [Shewanella]KPN75483.1 type IV pilin biogenesis protein [Shewanella sp. Sh95]MCL1069292.1 type IV pilin biogenesis protein [Shewanella xiamenensis]MDV5391269.1 PilC/PilY family type IV pilus protein [Shewanella xiamenensis]BDQ65173.1 type IV pili system adhesin PilY [Shewanella xiamenensis]GGM82215.1 type IV pili system adhesin PilY [Shewanella xiamenensis]